MKNTHVPRLCVLVLTLHLPVLAGAATIVCVDARLDTRTWVEKRLQDADVILLGHVVAEETPDRQPAMPRLEESVGSMKELAELIRESSKPDYETSHYQSVSLDVQKQWKGPPFRLITVKNHVVPGQFGIPLQVGKSYLIFAHKQEGSVHTISTVCKSTLDAANAKERIEVLDQIVEAGKPIEGEPH